VWDLVVPCPVVTSVSAEHMPENIERSEVRRTETEGSAPLILGLPPDPPHEPSRALVVAGPDVWSA